MCGAVGAQTSASGAGYAARANADMRERGVKTIVVDPYLTEEAAKADIWLPVRPMSDIAMSLLVQLHHLEQALRRAILQILDELSIPHRSRYSSSVEGRRGLA